MAQDCIDLSPLPWDITLDRQAEWLGDSLLLPPVDIKAAPVNLPTGGWQLLSKPDKRGVVLPATVEQHLWGTHNGQTFGVAGNYLGVSWFTTRVHVPLSWRGRRVVMNVGSVRFRAEVFVNRRLAGYDLVNSTPFEIDVTPYIIYGADNDIAFRITDPNGNLNWKDSRVFAWGRYLTNPSHAFGGITGRVTLSAVGALRTLDIFVKNQPKPHKIVADITVSNATATVLHSCVMRLTIREHATGRKVYVHDYPVTTLPCGETTLSYPVSLPKARLWSPDEPNLYDLTAHIAALPDSRDNVSNSPRATGVSSSLTQRFGFRWFEIRTVGGDKQFFLNGRRIVLRTAISWSFWPDNGIAPTDDMALRQVKAAKSLGLNMLNFHRTIGQPNVLNYADSLGLLYFEEPGGNQYPAQKFDDGTLQTRFYFAYRNEKLRRMIVRDRSHPSLIIYNLHNERGAYPQAEDYRQLRMAHELDPTRLLTYNSCNGENPEDRPDAKFKLHFLPNDTTARTYGWYDRHHAGGPGCYHDQLYLGPNDYHRYSAKRDEIVYWGEEGAIGTPPRLQLIRDEILRNKATHGWEADDYLRWYAAYDRFLSERGFRQAFPNVDSLTRAMGNVALYYQGRVIENIRISNTVDAYAVNGWESMKLENHSGIVDVYRNPKGDPETMARYGRPLYVAVKLNHKVLAVGDTTTVDAYIVNELGLSGSYTLRLTARDAAGNVVATCSRRVNVKGGNVYGQLLTAGWRFTPKTEGYTTIAAELLRGKTVAATGDDRLYAVAVTTEGVPTEGCIADTTGMLQQFMQGVGRPMPTYRKGVPTGRVMLAGAFEPDQWGSAASDIMDWVCEGNTLVIVDGTQRWAEWLASKEVLEYRGAQQMGKSWFGGNFFCRKHPALEGLPQDCAFNWEYQCFATYDRRRLGLRELNGECVVGCVSDHKKEVYSALTVIPAGRGKVIITTLDIPACLRGVKAYTKKVDTDGLNESMNTFNTSNRNPANIVGQRLLLNLLRL